MAAIEVYQSDSDIGGNYSGRTQMWNLASFFSVSLHFNIIDSYSAIVGRYKGDPIADTQWTSPANIGLGQNDWIVIECQTQHPTLDVMGYIDLPKWQGKFQIADRFNYIADPSDPTGVKWPKNHGSETTTVFRFAPYGGWDLADSLPDFNPSSPPSSGDVSTQNHMQKSRAILGTTATIWNLICADGCLMRIGRYHGGAYNFIQLPQIIGDIIPISKTHMPMPRAALNNGFGSGSSGIIDTGGPYLFGESNLLTNGGLDYSTTDGSYGGISFWDEDENLIQNPYYSANRSALQWALGSQHSPHPDIELIPFIPIPSSRTPYFAFPYVRKAMMPGISRVNNKQWLTMGHGWGPAVVWDGSSAIYQ